MKTRTMWVIIALVSLMVLITGGTGAFYGQRAPSATVADSINYQGRLTDPGGVPLDGTFPMRFQIYNAANLGTLLWDSGIFDVPVNNGYFNAELAIDTADFDGRALWLRIYVNSEWLSPRQELLPAPYALSLRPGAQIERTTSGNALETLNTATGTALWASSADGWGVFGHSENSYAVYGSDSGTTQGKGYGGYFTSNTGVGVYGYSSATSVTANAYTPGVYGRSANGVGVLGASDDDGSGVMGLSDGYGVYGRSYHSHGVRGTATGDAFDEGYGGHFSSDAYRGLYAQSSQSVSYYAGYFKGRNDTSAGIYIDGTLTASGSKSGYVVDVCLNDGPDPLELGDVVAVAGVDTPIIGEIPVMRVHKATDDMASAVIGVVDQRFLAEQKDRAQGDSLPHPDAATPRVADGTAIQTGEYVSIVTLGAFKAIKVDASYGAIQPGDLLVASPNPGYAMRADSPDVGTVIGKALDALDTGVGIIPVLVTLD